MRKKILLVVTSFLMLSSVSASAINKTDLKELQEKKFTGWWCEANRQWTYFKDGELVTNKLIYIDGAYYNFKDDGTMIKGWSKFNNNWYYFNTDGSAKTGWFQDGSNWYYLNQDGTMAHDTYINNYYVNSSGAWVK